MDNYLIALSSVLSCAVGYAWFKNADSYVPHEYEFNFLASVMAGLSSFMILLSIIEAVV